MTKREAIEKLSALVARIPDLEKQKDLEESEDFKKWQHDARAVLKHVFSEEREYLREFDGITYYLGGFTDRTPQSAFQEAFRSGLRSARAMIQSRIDEVTQFWPDERVPNTGTERSERAQPVVVAIPTPPPAGPNDRVFVIHGRQLLGEFHAFLRALGLEPLEWSKARSLTGKPTPYTWEIVDTALKEARAIVALLTPDDEARLQQHLWSEHDSALEKEFLSQPRQNVLFEAGVAYGRRPEHTVLVRVGSHRPMSDLAGHHIVQLDDSAQSRHAVAEALRTAGCDVDTSGSDWFKSGVFSLPVGVGTKRDVNPRIREDAAKLALYKTHIKGYTDLTDAATVVANIHSFFFSHPIYLNAASHAFLEKYPLDFRDQVTLNHSVAVGKWPLDQLKRDVESLHIDGSDDAAK